MYFISSRLLLCCFFGDRSISLLIERQRALRQREPFALYIFPCCLCVYYIDIGEFAFGLKNIRIDGENISPFNHSVCVYLRGEPLRDPATSFTMNSPNY